MLTNVKSILIAVPQAFWQYLQNFIQSQKLLSDYLVPNIPSTIYPIASMLFVKQWYKNEPSSLFREHIKGGGEIEENRIVIGIALISFVIALVIAFTTVIFSGSLA